MSEMPLRQYLIVGGSIGDLATNLGIAVKPHPAWPNLLHFSYSQIDSPKDNLIVHHSRGTILDSSNDWKVVCYPFKRFANYGETWADPIDWNTARVGEKIDGSLMCVWFYDQKWNVSTSGSASAQGAVGDYPFTFAELFWKTLKEEYHSLWIDMQGGVNSQFFSSDNTYCFELTSIYNRVVCSYGNRCDLTLLGVRNNKTYREYAVSNFSKTFPVVKEFPLTTIDEILEAAERLDPMSQEGFVCVDQHFNRVKVKSPAYVAIHHLKDGFGQRRMIRLIQLGEESEILSYFPDYRELFEDIKKKIDDYISTLEREYDTIKHIKDRKEFAFEALKTTYSGVMFAMYLGKTSSIRNYILHEKRPNGTFCFPEDKIENMIGLKERIEVLIEE